MGKIIFQLDENDEIMESPDLENAYSYSQYGLESKLTPERESAGTTSLDANANQPEQSQEQYYDADEHGFRRIIRNFTPSWFIITMSTGILSVLLHQLPYNGRWLRIISTILFTLNVGLFILFSFISALRYSLHPELWGAVIRHPHQSLFLGTFPVGLATIINMIVLVCAPAWGYHWVILAWTLWWIDGIIALAICFHMSYVIMTNRKGELAEMTALWLIPIVSVVIVGSTGGIVAAALTDPRYKLWTLVISYVLWGIGIPFSWMILTLYFLRLTIHEPLPREVIISALLPIGPLGLGAFSIMSFGRIAKSLFPVTHSLPAVPNAGDILYVVGFMVGLIMWGFAVVWFVVAILMILLVKGIPFNMGWWGFIFPICIFTLATITIGNELESRFFKVLGEVLAVIAVILWLIVATGTIIRSITGKMFFAPCLGTDLKLKQMKKRNVAIMVETGQQRTDSHPVE